MSFFQKSLSTTAGRIISTGFQFLTVFLIAAVLGNKAQGEFAFLTLIPFVASAILNAGLPQANLFLTGKARVQMPTLASGSFLWSLFAGGFFCLFWFTLSRRIDIFHLFPVFQPFIEKPFLLDLSVLSVVPLLYFNILSISYIGRGSIRFFNTLLIGRSLLALLLIAVFILIFGAGLSPVFLLWVLSFCAAGILILSKEIPGMFPQGFHQLRDYYKQVFPLGLKFLAANLSILLMYRLDHFLVMHFRGSEDLGRYQLATLAAESLLFLTGPMFWLNLTRTARDGKTLADRQTPQTFRIVFWFFLVSSLPLLGAFSLLLWILAKTGYEPGIAVIAFALLLPGVVFHGVDQIISSDLAGRGKQMWNTYVVVMMLGLNIGLDLWWIPRMGIAGAALASSTAYIISSLITLTLFTRFSGVRWGQLFFLGKKDLQFLARRFTRKG
jgi:O-antigen/teichoic acid export membrane protein